MEERINSIIKKLEQISTRGIDTILMGQALSELLVMRDSVNCDNAKYYSDVPQRDSSVVVTESYSTNNGKNEDKDDND